MRSSRSRRRLSIFGEETPRRSTAFGDRRPPKDIVFGVGDIISVTIFEAGAGGCSCPRRRGCAGNFVTLPNQTIDNLGNITIPYAPPIVAKGRTAPEVQRAIVDALKKRAIEPQAVVSLVEARTSLISVLERWEHACALSGERLGRAYSRCDHARAGAE